MARAKVQCNSTAIPFVINGAAVLSTSESLIVPCKKHLSLAQNSFKSSVFVESPSSNLWRARRIAGGAQLRRAQRTLQPVLILAISVALGLVTIQNPLFVLLFIFDLGLVGSTWFLASRHLLNGIGGTLWIGTLLLTLLSYKLLQLDASLISAAWLGTSYLIFRLLHVTFDARKGRLGQPTLGETLIYALHPATLIAGPIDRLQHSVSEQRRQAQQETQIVSDKHERASFVTEGIWRIFLGLFKKFGLAGLCYIFMGIYDRNLWPDYQTAAAWLWLFAFSFYLYFDFAGYSDIAIGVGYLMGIRLPENFSNPYLQPSLVRFWQSWHITLSNWLRDYIYFPYSRAMLNRFGKRWTIFITLTAHLLTMIACGLWHGLGTGFLVWGILHGLGLFVNSLASRIQHSLRLPSLPKLVGIIITFSFVTLSWVFFSRDFGSALHFIGQLFRG